MKRRVGDIIKSPVRAFDILTWYPWLPDSFRNRLERFANYHRQLFRWDLDIKICEARYHNQIIEPSPFNENDWAAVCGEPFGFESSPTMIGGFAHFVAPSSNLTILATLKLVETHSTMRCCRMLLAYERLSQELTVSHPSDQRIPGQYVLWLTHAKSYLIFLRDTDPRAASMAPQLKYAIDSVPSFFGTLEELMEENWRSLNPTDSVAVRGSLFEMHGGEGEDEESDYQAASYSTDETVQQVTAQEAEALRRELPKREQAEREQSTS